MNIVDAILKFKRELAAEDRARMLELTRRWGQVARGLEKEIESFALHLDAIRQRGETVPRWKLYRMDRYRQLFEQAHARYSTYAKMAQTEISDRQNELAKRGIDDAAEALRAAGLTPTLSVLPADVLETMMGMTADGSPLSKLLMDKFPDSWARMEDGLLRGLSTGKSPIEIAKAMAGELNKLMVDVLCIVQTETLRAYREATRLGYIDSGAVDGYKRITTKDSRTCVMCIALDGKEYKIEQPLVDHPMGRCALVPIVKGIPKPTWQTASDWFDTLDPERQRKMLGPGRYELYRDKRATLEQMVRVTKSPDWGETVGLVPLKEFAAAG